MKAPWSRTKHPQATTKVDKQNTVTPAGDAPRSIIAPSDRPQDDQVDAFYGTNPERGVPLPPGEPELGDQAADRPSALEEPDRSPRLEPPASDHD